MSALEHEWTRVRRLLERAIELEHEQRARFLDESCAGEPALRGELEELLARDSDDHALEPPCIENTAHARRAALDGAEGL